MLQHLARLVDFLLPATLALLVGLAAMETLAWGFFAISWPQISEVNSLLMVVFGLLGAAQGVQRHKHLGVETVVRRLPASWQGAAQSVAAALVTLFGALLAVYGIALAGRVHNTLPATGISSAWQYVPAALGGALIALFAGAQIFPSTRNNSTRNRHTETSTGNNTTETKSG
jgi:TRAP-type C4-dicarboxylate transport system permease small subunit